MTLPLFPELPEITEAIERPTAEDYAQAARYALSRRKLPLAAQQAAAALALEPRNRAYRSLLNDVASAARDPLKLLELRTEGTFYGLAAARAWTLARRGSVSEALELLVHVAAFRPNVPFLTWIDEWRERGELARKVEPVVVATLLGRTLEALLEARVQEGGLLNLRSVLALAEDVARVHPEHVGLCVARSRVLRELGESSAALAVADSGPKGWETRFEVALAQRDLGNVEGQLEALRDAAALGPDEASTYVALGRALVTLGRLEEAERAFATANEVAPAPWPSVVQRFLSWLRRPNEVNGQELGVDDGEVGLQLLRDVGCYESVLPDPLDSVVGVLRSALSRAARSAGTGAVHARVRVEGSAAPSARLAYQLGLGALGKSGQLTLLGTRPSTKWGGLWRLEGEVAVSAVEPPSPDVLARVEELARTRFGWDEWSRRAAQAPSSAPRGLLGVLVRPPPPPSNADAVQWLVHVHVAVALLIASSDSTWAEREAALQQTLSATDDWICNVGIVAWYASALREPALRGEAERAYRALLPDARGPLPHYARTLAILGMKLGGDDVEAWRALRARAVFSLLGD